MSTGPVVVMGVAGSGKSVVGQAVAGRLGRPFTDADDLHPEANVEKMRRGEPLTDDDRRPWLDAVGSALAASPAPVVACSALKRAYRDRLRSHAPDVRFVHLDGDRDLIADRMAERVDHFMPLSLLDDQFSTLEPLDADEPGRAVPIDGTVAEVVAAAVGWLR
ncbi:MAG: gluconokinase [Actinomycetota bacterium]